MSVYINDLPNNGAGIFKVVGCTFLQLVLIAKYMAKFPRPFGQYTFDLYIFPFYSFVVLLKG